MAESIKKYKQFENVEFSQHVFHIFHSHFFGIYPFEYIHTQTTFLKP